MGMVESAEEKEHRNYMSNYVFERKENHPHFGDVTIYHLRLDPTQKAIEKRKVIKPDTRYTASIKTMDLKSKVNVDYTCKVLKHTIIRRTECASEVYEHLMVLEYYEESFEKSIERYTNNPNAPQIQSEEFAWLVMYDLVSVASFYRRYSLNMVELSPATVLLTPAGGVKFLDMHFLTFLATLEERMELLHPYKAPIAPEQRKARQISSKSLTSSQMITSQEKIDVFMIGVTVLCIITNKDLDFYYNFATEDIHYEKIQAKVTKLDASGYSNEFIDTLISMLQENPDVRADVKSLVNRIKQIIQPARQRAATVLI
jgi:hypothetical protein